MRKQNAAALAARQETLAELLGAQGFKAMAEQAAKEADPENLELYAQIVLRNARPEQAEALRQRLAFLRLV